MMFMAHAGRPMWERVVMRNSWEMDGKALEKSRRMHAPFSSSREVIILAVSTSRRLARMERPGRKPCW